MTDRDITRRRLMGAGAAGAAAAAFAGLSLDAALAQDAVPADAAAGSSRGSLDAMTGVGAPSLVQPTRIPGARVGTIGPQDFSAMSSSAGISRVLANGGVYATSGQSLEVRLPLDAGSRLLRLDVYCNHVSSDTTTVILAKRVLHTLSSAIVDGANVTGTGLIGGAMTPATPITVGIGESYYLNVGALTSSSVIVGVTYQYFDANPQLNLLGAPIRVYDSRTGFAPTGVTKGKLADGSTRNIDGKIGNAVPAGAAAALVNITVTNTSAAGFLAAYRNGIAWPGNSSVNWDHAGTSASATTVVALDANAVMRAYVASGASTDVIVDVIGYYA